MAMPAQKPGKSKQDYQTPKELLNAVRTRLHIPNFDIDLAASAKNAVTKDFYDEERNALAPHVHWRVTRGGWAWCNPPYTDIGAWAAKAVDEAIYHGAHIAMLVPASVGANWWRDHVERWAYQLFLNGRPTFVGCDAPYPKDCVILLYTPWRATGNQTWDWSEEEK